MIRVLGTAFAALMGLAFGSFLNVCLTRWPQGESIVEPRSHCRNCGRMLAWWENVPLLSWLALRGRCRTCGSWIGWRYPIVELTTGGIWAYLTWRMLGDYILNLPSIQSGQSPPVYIPAAGTLEAMILSWLLLGLAVLDAEHFWLADAVTIPGMIFGLTGTTLLLPDTLGWTNPQTWLLLGARVLGCAVAAGLILFIRWLYKLIRHREGLGLGDAKLMAMLAAWLGLSGALLSFAIGVILGSLSAIILLARGAKPTTQETWATTKLPLGTFLCIGGIVTSLWGQPIIAAYLRWAGF
jgi:leader peptidase (prepilin peptidase) / N-methyltransferase